MKVFIDNEYKCHATNDGTLREIETDFFDGKCKQFIEGYRFVPAGETWVREDGLEFTGEMIAPWKNYDMLVALQAQYEEMLSKQADMRAVIDAIYGGVTDDGT